MKKHFLALVAITAFGVTQAQEYNKWTVELGGGVNKPVAEMSAGYATSTPSFWTADLGLRYMFNNKFGLRLGGGYDNFQGGDNSRKFDSNLWNINLQAVANIGRALSFETWTSDLGLLAHAGVGYGQLRSDAFSSADQVAFGVAGLTPQLRISNRVTLFGDASVYLNARQQNTFDGFSRTSRRGIQGVKFTGTIGLSIALGKHGKHVDWYSEESKVKDIQEQIAGIENNLSDLKDQVAAKQNKMNDANGNNVPDEIENYLNDNFAKNGQVSTAMTSKDIASDLIKKGYISVYFDFNSSQPQISSTWAADFISKYLTENKGASVHIVGYADELGGVNYNQSLSLSRAEAVKRLLIDTGIDASRITTEGRGEDTSVNKKSPRARQIARRATFELK
ncbi:OmpA family protein [Capnocytophaga canimorsus]|uniref:OmpA family protein n=1 Tax=Capnocytophaga canimorsus TaxID=28188 RepID=UPI0037D408D5